MKWSVVLLTILVLAGTTNAEEPATTIDLRPLGLVTEHLYGGRFNAPRAVCYDRVRDELWIADTQNDTIAVFTPDGVPLFSFAAVEHLKYPMRLAVDPKGRLLVIEGDRTHIRIFDYRGTYRGELELKGVGEKPNFGAIAFDGEGNLYVGENTTGRVLVYSSDLKLRRHFGTRGNEEGQFQSIADIAVDENGNVYVIDHQVLAVQVFDRRGDYVRGWGKHEMGRENFSLPEGVALDSKGHVIVVDALRHEIKFFDREGNFLARFGGYGARYGQVAFPTAVAVDGRNRVYVAERGGSRIQAFEQLEAATPNR